MTEVFELEDIQLGTAQTDVAVISSGGNGGETDKVVMIYGITVLDVGPKTVLFISVPDGRLGWQPGVDSRLFCRDNTSSAGRREEDGQSREGLD